MSMTMQRTIHQRQHCGFRLKLLIAIALFLFMLPLKGLAQTFYEIDFDIPGDETYTGLIIYYDDDNVKMRLTSPKTLSENKYYEANYTCHVEDKKGSQDVGVMYYEPDDEDMPYLIWMWTKRDLSDMAMEPHIAFNLDDSDEWIQAKSFEEIPLSKMDEEYVSQFYNEDEPEYKLLLSGSQTVRQQVTQSIAPQGGPTTLHLIVAANTNVSDIGQACKVDLNNVLSEFRGVAKATGMTFKQYLVSGNNYGKEALANTIANLQPGSNDVVVFVYTGHGFRFQDQEDYYPNMDLSPSSYDDVTENYVAFTDVYKTIAAKGARLNIVLSDCCNSEIDADRPLINTNSLFSRANNSYDVNKLRKLFLRSKGDIVATAASPGQYSWCGNNGGFFLLSFIESLRSGISALKSTQPTWDGIINNTIDKAKRKSTNGNGTKTQNGLKYVQVKAI